MNIVNGILIENLLEGDLFRVNDDYYNKVRTALNIQLEYLTYVVDDETKEFVNNLVDLIASEIKNDFIRKNFLLRVRSNLFGSIAIFWGTYPKEDTLLGELIERALLLSMASKKACQIDDVYIFEKGYVYLNNINVPFIVTKINDDEIFLVNSENFEQLNISYDKFEGLVDIQNTKDNSIRSYIFDGQIESISHVKEDLTQYVEMVASKILNDKIRNEFLSDCLTEFRIKHPFARMHNNCIRDVGFVIDNMLDKYHIRDGYVEAKDRFFYVGNEVVMKDMQEQFDTIISYIDENKVIVSNKFNKLSNVSEYTIDEFKENISVLSDYGIDSNVLNMKYKPEYFPMVLAENMLRINDSNKYSQNIIKNYDIYKDDLLVFLQYRTRNIKDRRAVDSFIKNIIEIASGTNAGHKGIWDSQSLLEIIDNEWHYSYISRPSIYMLGNYYYVGNRLYLKDNLNEFQIEHISENEIILEHPYKYTNRRVFKTVKELEANCVSESDLDEIERQLNEIDGILDNDEKLRVIIIRLNQIQYAYRLGDAVRERAGTLYTKVNKEASAHYFNQFVNMSNEELKSYIVKHMITTGLIIEEKDDIKDIVNKFLRKYNGKMEICRALWRASVEVAMDKKMVACCIKGKEDFITFNIKDFSALLKEESIKHQNKSDNIPSDTEVIEPNKEEVTIENVVHNNTGISTDIDTSVKEEIINLDVNEVEVSEICNKTIESKEIILEELVDKLVEDIFYDNECEFVKLKSIKQVSIMIDANFKIRNSIMINKKEIPLLVKDRFISFVISDNESIDVSFECIAEELIKYKNNSMQQIDLFSMLS